LLFASKKNVISQIINPGDKGVGGAMPRRKKRIDHDPIVADFGRRLREIRQLRGMTQAYLAEEAKVGLSYITRLENGTSAPGIDLVARLAAALGTTVADLLPTTAPPDDVAVLRRRARTLFDTLVQTDDRQLLGLLNQFLARLSNSQ
jgi:HTH-type transcriptional regulator, repressor for puuD